MMEFKVEKELKLKEQIFDARFHPNSQNNLVAAATIAGDILLIESGQLTSKLKKHHKGSSIRKVRFTKDNKLVSVARTVKVHDLVANETINTLKRDDGQNTTFYCATPLGNNIITAGDDDGGIFVWDTRNPDRPVLTSHDCDQYISDIDGKYEARRIMVCTSGEGTLTAYDLRANKMIEPQSELFDAGFQCLRMIDTNRKVVVGGEDGGVYVFNQGEWAHTSGKFTISDDVQNRGKYSVDCIDILQDDSVILVGCSDGKMRALTLWPHQVLKEISLCKRSSIESIHVNPRGGESQIVVSGENYINFVNFEEKEDVDCDDDDDSDGADQHNSESAGAGSSAAGTENNRTDDGGNQSETPSDTKLKKIRIDNDDYLNIFKK